MNIISITVGNFKNLAETTIELNKITALISINNYGKTNLLEAIDFAFNFISASTKERNNMMRWVKAIPLIKKIAKKPFKFVVELENPTLNEYRFIRYSYTFSWLQDGGEGARIIDETIEARPNTSVKYTSYLKRNENKFRSGKSTGFRKLVFSDDKLALDYISAMDADEVELVPVVNSIINLKYRMCGDLDLGSSFQQPFPIEFDFGSHPTLAFDDDDIPRALSVLKKEDPSSYQLFVETALDLFPEFESIDLQQYVLQADTREQLTAVLEASTANRKDQEKVPYHLRNEFHRIMIQTKHMNQPISMEYMSAGTKRIFWLIVNALVSEKAHFNLLGIDEVETSIHPRLIKGILESTSEILEDASILITSHSPYLIQYLKANRIYVGIPTNDGVATFRKIKSKKMNQIHLTAQSREMTIGEYLFTLISGGSDSIELLETYLED